MLINTDGDIHSSVYYTKQAHLNGQGTILVSLENGKKGGNEKGK